VKQGALAVTDDLDMVAGGLMLVYGSMAEALVAHQVERVRRTGDGRKAERWRRIGARVRQRKDVAAAVA
jgi:hypothetical protein